MENIHETRSDKFPAISYRKIGQGPAIVLIHGFPASGKLWHKIWAELSKDFTLTIPDLPGAGGSKYNGSELSMEDMAESIKLVLDDCGIDKAVIAGHSMGGYTALAFAELYAERLQGLSLVHSFAGADTEEKKDTRRKSIELMKKDKGKEAFVKEMIPKLFSKSFKEKHPEVLEREVQNGVELEVNSMVSFYTAMINRPDRTKVLIDAAFPVQFIIGKEDTAVPVDVSLQQSSLPNRTFVRVYEDTGHMSMLEQPEQLVADLKEFATFCYSDEA